jgi:hypothetical protein
MERRYVRERTRALDPGKKAKLCLALREEFDAKVRRSQRPDQNPASQVEPAVVSPKIDEATPATEATVTPDATAATGIRGDNEPPVASRPSLPPIVSPKIGEGDTCEETRQRVASRCRVAQERTTRHLRNNSQLATSIKHPASSIKHPARALLQQNLQHRIFDVAEQVVRAASHRAAALCGGSLGQKCGWRRWAGQ